MIYLEIKLKKNWVLIVSTEFLKNNVFRLIQEIDEYVILNTFNYWFEEKGKIKGRN